MRVTAEAIGHVVRVGENVIVRALHGDAVVHVGDGMGAGCAEYVSFLGFLRGINDLLELRVQGLLTLLVDDVDHGLLLITLPPLLFTLPRT